MKLSLSRSEADGPDWPDPHVTGRLASIADSLAPDALRVDLIVVTDDFIRSINRQYRGIDRPTDVISFSYIEDGSAAPGVVGRSDEMAPDDLAGEIYLSRETLERDARSEGVEVDHLFLRIGVHGMLHVLGYDHESDEDAARMEREERRLLASCLTQAEVEALF